MITPPDVGRTESCLISLEHESRQNLGGGMVFACDVWVLSLGEYAAIKVSRMRVKTLVKKNIPTIC